MNESIHDLDGAYVLGALAPEERRTYEQHLAECTACSRSVQDLAGLPGILGRLDGEEALALRDLPDAAVREGEHRPDRVSGITRRVRRSRRRARMTAALVVVAVLLIGGGGGWALLHATPPAARQVVAARTLHPVGSSGLTADLTVTSVGWGTRLDWSCDYRGEPARGSYAPTSYSLVVHTGAGAAATVATWTSDAGEAKGLVAATAIPVDAIRSVDIRVTGSPTPLAATRF